MWIYHIYYIERYIKNLLLLGIVYRNIRVVSLSMITYREKFCPEKLKSCNEGVKNRKVETRYTTRTMFCTSRGPFASHHVIKSNSWHFSIRSSNLFRYNLVPLFRLYSLFENQMEIKTGTFSNSLDRDDCTFLG